MTNLWPMIDPYDPWLTYTWPIHDPYMTNITHLWPMVDPIWPMVHPYMTHIWPIYMTHITHHMGQPMVDPCDLWLTHTWPIWPIYEESLSVVNRSLTWVIHTWPIHDPHRTHGSYMGQPWVTYWSNMGHLLWARIHIWPYIIHSNIYVRTFILCGRICFVCVFYQGSHQIFKTKFPDISLTFQAVWRKIPWHVVHKSKQVIWSAPPPLHRILFLASTRGGMSNVFNVSNLLWGFGGVTPEKILKFHIAKYAFSRILNDTTQATVKIPWHKPQFPKIPWHFPDIPVIF